MTATDAASNTSSAASWKIIVDSLAPTVPVITLINDDVGSITGSVANNGWVTNDNTPTISGTGEPGSLVSLYDGSFLMTVMLVDSTGTQVIPFRQIRRSAIASTSLQFLLRMPLVTSSPPPPWSALP